MSGRIIISGLALFTLAFGVALWWAQTRGWYEEHDGVNSIVVDGEVVQVNRYRGIDAETSPLKLRACFLAAPLNAPPAEGAEPLVSPGWFECFNARQIADDLSAGLARAVLAASNDPWGFDRIVAQYPDGRAFQWRQLNACGDAGFSSKPIPETCPERGSD